MPRARRTSRLAIAVWTLGCLLSTAVLGQADRQAQVRRGIFGSVEFRSATLAALPQWTRVVQRMAEEKPTYDACAASVKDCPFPAVAGWLAKVQSLKGLDRTTQLIELNRYFNRWPYRDDRENYGTSDYWASPLEFLRASGDCEDYAIIKFASLRILGYENDALRIVVVMDTLRNLPHAVLSVRMDEKFYIMDSLYDAVLTDDRNNFYVPQYSVNETTRWAHIIVLSPPVATIPTSGDTGTRP